MSDENRALSDIVWTPERGLAEPEIRSIAWNNFLLSDENYSGRWRTSAEVRITPETALQSTVVLACCRILAETISSLPLHVYRRGDDGAKEIARDIPLYRVLSFAPNSWQTKFEFFEQMVMTLCLWGNSYTQIKSGRYGAVSELINLHPSRMDVERLENGRLRYQYTNPETGRIEPYTQDQIMHVRWTPEPDGIKGMVPVEVAREAIALARACEIHASKYWANSARPGVVLQTDGTLSAESAERLRENWERLHRGVDRAWKTAILTGGLKAEPIGFTNEQSQYVDSRRYQSEEIARVYRLPLRLVQGQSGGNPEVEGQDFVTYTLVPWLRRIESAISRSLIYNDDLFVAEFDVRGLMRGDSGSRAAYYSTMTNLGIFSINDCRRLENMPPLENGDKHFVGMNMQTLEDAVKPKPDPMAAMMAGGGAPPPAQGGVPSLPDVKTGKAPNEAEQGEKSIPKEEGTLVSYGNGKTGRVKHVMEEGTLDLKSGEKIEVKPGEPVALVVDEKTGEEAGVPVSQLKPVQEKRALSPQNQALYDAQEEIVKANGRWPQQGAAGAHYMEKNPFANRGIACRNCIYFEEGGSCEIVKGQIAPNAICKLWIIPEEKLQMPESRDCGTGAGGFKEGNKCAGGSDGDGEPVRGFRRGEGDKKQTRIARKLYQMGSSERQIKALVSQLGGKPGRSSAKVTGDKIGISVRDSSGKDKFYIEIGYNGAGVVPVGRTLSSDEAKEIETLAKQALPEKISGRLYNRGKEYPVSVHRDDTALNRGRRVAPKGKRAFCPTGDGGGIKNDCSSKGDGESQDRPKTLEQQRLEAAGLWEPDYDAALDSPDDGLGNGGFAPDAVRYVSLPGAGEVPINVDDPEEVEQYVGMLARQSKQTPEEFAKSKKFNGTPAKLTPEDKVKIFGGNKYQYVAKHKRLGGRGGWGSPENDRAASEAGSLLRAAGINPNDLSDAIRRTAKAAGKLPKNEMYSALTAYKKNPRGFLTYAAKKIQESQDLGGGKSRRSAEPRAFCATGEGGGIKNDCPPGGTDSGKADRIAEKARRDIDLTKGFSIHPVTEDSPTVGYMVGVVKAAEVVIDSKEEVTGELISKFMEDNKSQFESRPSLHVGGWIDGKSGQIYLDLSEQFDSIDDAIDAAESTDQLAIWDLNEKKEIRKDEYDARRTKPKQTRSLRLPDGSVGGEDREGAERGSQASDGGVRRQAAAEGLVRELRDAGEIDVPSVVYRPKAQSRAVAEYDHETDTIYVSDALTDEVAAAFRHAAARGWVSQPNPLLHELAHRHHALADAESYEASKSLVFSDAESRAIAESVSRYATSNGREFVAEVVSGLWAGKEYGDDVMRMLSTITNGNFSP